MVLALLDVDSCAWVRERMVSWETVQLSVLWETGLVGGYWGLSSGEVSWIWPPVWLEGLMELPEIGPVGEVLSWE